MLGLASILVALLCIYIVSNLLQAQPEPVNGRYSVPGRFYTLKKLLVICFYRYRLFRQRKGAGTENDADRLKMGLGRRKEELQSQPSERKGGGGLGISYRSSVEEMECVQELVDDCHAIDSVYFMGFTEVDKTYFIVRICRKPNDLCEIWVLLRVDGIGYFEHPIHPDTISSVDSKNSWSGGGLKMECLEPHRRWRITFSGLLRRGPYKDKWTDEEEELLHVKFTFIWTAFSTVFDFDTDLHASAIAQGIAQEKWSKAFFDKLTKYNQQQTHYEQWGQYVGEIEIEGHERNELLLRGLRDHSYGIRNWAHMHRYVLLLAHFENGLSVNLIILSISATTTNMNIGYVMFPNGKKAGIDWSDASLAEIADDGIIADLYRVSFTAEGQLFHLQISIDKDASPVMYGGLTWESRIHECITYYRLNLTVRGWGIMEFHYRNESGRQAPDFIPFGKLQEPVVPACSKLVLALSDKTCQCAAVVGSKGAQLAQLMEMQNCYRNQFFVPIGLCVTIAALEYHMKKNNCLQQAVAELNYVICNGNKNGNLHELCGRCVELFKRTALSPEIECAIREQLTELRLLGAEERLATRSSAIGEDTEGTSAAGQLSTELGVKGFEEVCEAVQKCWASLYSFQAVQYRHQRGQPVASGMGVVIQQMVPAQAAGVLFTCNPVTGHSGRMVINANYGLGESVVSGHSEPDTITLSHNLKGKCQIIKKEIGVKKRWCLENDDGGIKYEDTLISDAAKCCISDDVILRLGQVAFQVRKTYGDPRDIEWAVKGTKIYLLQARPITTFNTESEFELMHEFDSALSTDYEWMTTSNVGEMMPGAVTPLTSSIFVRAIEYALQELSMKAGGNPCFSPYTHKYLGICCSHLFLNLMSLNANMEQNNIITQKKMNDFELLGRVLNELSLHDVILIHGQSPLWKRIFNMFRYLQYMLTADSRIKRLMEKMKTYQIQPANQALEFYFNIDRQLPEYFEAWCISLSKSCSSGMWNAVLISILSKGKAKWTPELMADVAALYSTCTDVLPADIPASIEAIAEAIQTQGKRSEFLKLDAETAVSWLLSQESGDAGWKFQNFLKKHGFRCLREAEFHEKSWMSHPVKLLPAIQRALQSGKVVVDKVVLSSEEAIASINSSVSWIRKYVVRLILPEARKAISDRELFKAEAIRMNDVFKAAYWKLAKLMVLEGYLPDEDLLFFLTHSEIGQVLQLKSTNIISKAQRRRRLLERQMGLQFKEMNIGKPVPIDQYQGEETGRKITLRGMTVSQGTVKGTARVVKAILDAECIQQGDILIVASTDIGWSPYFPLLRGLVTEIGGLLSHGAVVAREHGLPCIVSCKNATNLLKSGDTVILNGRQGFVQKVEAN
ncbi:putative phosphoenolpyruvate synthase isoform X1 [Hemiscyllium ocellatum]|uniref:putative phosphoenolpyruvate synthase isoform X1 n=1 Tax=Hemiscyllium ocellatum TaxID=170820 RepID=UPI002967110F|nr:putative phosphoenolpyruvate synthase isoform X1 [Hemiscyllium ocellatum]